MSDRNPDSDSSVMTLPCALGIAFVVLKLCGVIDWSWWWVTAPFWGGLAIALVVILVGLAIMGSSKAITTAKERRSKTIHSTDYEVIDKN